VKEFPKYSFFTRYRSKVVELTPENQEILRRRRERAQAERRRRFPQFYKD
jgi:hypothetical protein